MKVTDSMTRSSVWLFFLLALAQGGCSRESNVPIEPSGSRAAQLTAQPTAAVLPLQAQDEARWIESLKLSPEALRKDFEAGGEVVRKRPASGSQNAVLGDLLIRNKVRTRLQDDPEVPGMSLDVEVERGRVILAGRVGRFEELQRAMLAAFSVPEVTEVVSRLTVEPDDGSGTTKGEVSGTSVAK